MREHCRQRAREATFLSSINYVLWKLLFYLNLLFAYHSSLTLMWAMLVLLKRGLVLDWCNIKIKDWTQ